MFDETGTKIILALAAGWFLQYCLAFIQLRRFYKRVSELRRLGTTSIGKEGSAWRRRVYTVLVVDKNHIIQHIEELSGWTFMATLKPLPGLEGRPMSDLFDESLALPVKRKQLMALRNAASFILEAEERKKERQKAQEEQAQGAMEALAPDSSPPIAS